MELLVAYLLLKYLRGKLGFKPKFMRQEYMRTKFLFIKFHTNFTWTSEIYYEFFGKFFFIFQICHAKTFKMMTLGVNIIILSNAIRKNAGK